LIWLVRAPIAPASNMGEANTERSGEKWSSANQTASSPPRSATSISSNALSNACASLTPCGRSNS
jgi:hypothetical protein